MEFDCIQNSGRFFSALARDLKSLALSNAQFFQDGKQSYHAKFHMSFCLLYDYLDMGIEPSFRELSSHVHYFDYSPEIKGNGYRSILHVVQKCCLHLLQLVRYISSMRDSMLFRKKFYAQELEAYVSALGQLRALLYYALKLLNYCREGDLFTDSEVINDEIAQSLMLEIEDLNQECFYGRCIGFQFCSSMVRPLQALGIAMASYSEGYLETSSVMQMATSVFNSGKYFLDPELRGEQIVKATRTSDIRYCKALWGLAETGLMLQLPAFVCPSVEVDELFPLGPDAFELPLEDGSDTVVITPPCAHTGPGHVYVRLISAHLREGQQSLKKTARSKSPPTPKPLVDGLVIHIHGGGFVAHSSKSHEVYLRDWAHVFNVPILSIDYSLSPEMPFPRALEECFYAYAWIVKNCEQLGSTGKSIVMVGDSAGGNLAIATAMRAATFGIRRPEGLVSIYAVTMVSYTPSPARLLSLMDPLLSFGLLSRCLAAYAGVDEEHPLATPQTEEFQSQASLSSLQIQTMEASDQEWIIIAQDQKECQEIDQKLAASPIDEHRGRSVVDSLEDSFHGEEAEEEQQDTQRFQRSDTVESDEVEIFSQLAAAGSCVFPKERRKSKSGATKDRNPQSPDAEDGMACDGRELKSSMTLEGLQETAKNVVAGAQSMFSSLTSYIPKRGKQTSIQPADSSVNGDLPKIIVPDIDCFVDLSYSSDPVDGSSRENGSEPCFSESLEVHAQDAAATSDSSHNVPEITSETLVSVGDKEAQEDSQPVVHLDRGILENQTSGEVVTFSPSTFIRDPNASETGSVIGNSRPSRPTMGAKEDCLPASFRQSSLEGSKTCSETSDSSLFKSALASPFPGVTGEAMSFSYLDSPCCADGDLMPVAESSRPTVGVSPNSETASTMVDKSDHAEPSKLPTSSQTGVPSSLSFCPALDMTSATKSCHVTSPQAASPSDTDMLHSTNVDEPTAHPSRDGRGLSPNGPPCFTQEDFTCDQNSLCFMPSLPQERKDLLEDAIRAGDFWGEDNAEASSEKHHALSFQNKGRTVTTEGGSKCHGGSIRNDPHRAADTELGKSMSLNPVLEGDDQKTSHCFDMNNDVDLLNGNLASGVNNDSMKTCMNTAHSAVKPPSELKLAKTTSSVLYGNSTLHSGLSSETIDGDRDELDFGKSCLEFLTPSATFNDGCSNNDVVDGIFRSESAPALSSLMTPSPSASSKSISTSHRSGHNGLRMGMSPSDFKRRTFATQSPMNTMKKASVVNNPYMSPLMATEELIRGLPPVTMVACHLDPLIDDTIMFAKKLKKFNVPVDVHLVDDLPHGFLNFSLISTEAKQASRLCAQKVLDYLEKPV